MDGWLDLVWFGSDVSPSFLFLGRKPMVFGHTSLCLRQFIFGWWLELEILDLVWALQLRLCTEIIICSKWCDIKANKKNNLIQRVIISESKWHNEIMSYKPRFSWISMNVLMCVGFLVFFDSHSTSYLEMSYLYHVYIISHNVSRNKAKSRGM